MTTHRAHDGGFSLTETLVALLIISLSLAGVFTMAGLGVHVQYKVMTQRLMSQAIDAEHSRLAERLAIIEPVVAKGFTGTPDHFIVTRDGIASVGYKAPAGEQLLYVGDTGVLDHWPDERLVDGEGHTDLTRQGRLRAVVMTDGHGAPLFVVKLNAEETGDCQFDMVSRTCREVGS